MEIFKNINEIRSFVEQCKAAHKTIGLVPTMGALHRGHISLINACKKQCDITVVSVFVNPAQFNSKEDLEKYPVTPQQDIQKLKEASCEAVFIPPREEIYPGKAKLNIDFGTMGSWLEGKFRPGHFNGVGLVVSKLFNIVQPRHVFFGQKDLQQFFIIKILRDQLNFSVALTMVPTVRESDGLAMSSRNLRLNREERGEAPLLYKALNLAKETLAESGQVEEAKAKVRELFNASSRIMLEYFEVIHIGDFKPLVRVSDKKNTALCIAATTGNVRLIDNLMLQGNETP